MTRSSDPQKRSLLPGHGREESAPGGGSEMAPDDAITTLPVSRTANSARGVPDAAADGAPPAGGADGGLACRSGGRGGSEIGPESSLSAGGELPRESSSNEDFIGQVLEERFEILERVGSGGMSVVYKARHLFLDKIVALKVLRTAGVPDATSVARFQREARVISSLDHPNLLKVYAVGKTPDGDFYMVMDFLEGTTLAALMASSGQLFIERALAVFRQICAGLAHAHRRGVVHRDLKPSNVIIDADGDWSTWLVDFGIALLSSGDSSADARLTRAGTTCGSPPYMSPEQCLGQQLDARSDIYSLGCVLYELLTGQRPFAGSSAEEFMLKHLNEVPPRFKDVCPDRDFPLSLEAIAFCCLEKVPSRRYQSVSQLLDDLDSVGKGDETETEIIARFNPAGAADHAGRRHRRVWTFAAGAATAVCIGVFAWFMFVAPQGRSLYFRWQADELAASPRIDFAKLRSATSALVEAESRSNRKERAIGASLHLAALAEKHLQEGSPEHVMTISHAARLLQGTGEQRESARLFDRSIGLLEREAQEHWTEGRKGQAIGCLKEAQRLCIYSQSTQKWVPLLITLSWYHKDMGDFGPAEEAAAKAVELCKRSLDTSRFSQQNLFIASHVLADVYLIRNKLMAALPLCLANEQLSAQTFGENSRHHVQAQEMLMRCYIQMGKYKQAAEIKDRMSTM